MLRVKLVRSYTRYDILVSHVRLSTRYDKYEVRVYWKNTDTTNTTYDPTVDLYKYDQIRDTSFWKNTTSYKYEVVLRIPAVQFLLLLSQRVSMDMAIMWSPEEEKLVMEMKVLHSYATLMVKSL